LYVKHYAMLRSSKALLLHMHQVKRDYNLNPASTVKTLRDIQIAKLFCATARNQQESPTCDPGKGSVY
jgi:hypothetical protein